MEMLVSDLIDHPQNEYFFDQMEGQKRAEFLESINTSGIIEPLIVTQDNIIVSGHQRKAACIELGIDKVPCVIRHYEDRDGITKDEWITKDLIDTNVQQRGAIGGSELKAIRRVDALRGIYKIQRGGDRKSEKIKGGNPAFDRATPSLSEICAEAGSSRQSYTHNHKIIDMTSSLQELLESGNMGVDIAVDIVKRLSTDEQEQLFSMLPVAKKITSKIADPLIREIEKLRDDNAFFLADEDAASKHIDDLDLRSNEIREENERIKAGRGTDIEIELRRERDEARALVASLEDKNRIVESSLSHQKELRLVDSELGRTAEQQVVNLCNLVLSTVEPLSELPTSVFFKLSQQTRNNLINVIGQSIDGLAEIQNLLAGIAEAV